MQGIDTIDQSIKAIKTAIENNNHEEAVRVVSKNPDIVSEFTAGNSFYEERFMYHLQLDKTQYGSTTFLKYLKSMHYLPQSRTLILYLSEALAANKRQREEKADGSPIPIFQTTKSHLIARKTWSDIVSLTDTENNKSNHEIYRLNTLQRLRELGFTINTENIFNACITFLQQNTVIAMAFNGRFLFGGLNSYKTATYFNSFTPNSNNPTKRDLVERTLYRHLENHNSLQKDFLTNYESRPRYASLILLDNYTNPGSVPTMYGSSFIVFKNVVKFNSLFYPADSYAISPGMLSTYFNMGILLYQLSSNTLKALAHRVTKGHLLASYDSTACSGFGGYIEAHLPALNFLDQNIVQHIHLDTREYTLSLTELTFLQSTGITITVGASNPYPSLIESLDEAIVANNTDRINELVKSFPHLLLIANIAGDKPLFRAGKLNQLAAVGALIDNGADVNERDLSGFSLLHLAVSMNFFDLVALLLGYKKTDVDIKANSPNNPFDQATPIFMDASVEIFKLLQSRGASINSITSFGVSLLSTAVLNGNIETTKLIAQTQPDLVRHLANDGSSVLMDAVENGNPTLIDVVMQYSGNSRNLLNYKNPQGESALFIAVKQNKISVVEKLLSYSELDFEAKREPGDGITAEALARKNHYWLLTKTLITKANRLNSHEKNFHLLNLQAIYLKERLDNLALCNQIGEVFKSIFGDDDLVEPEKIIYRYLLDLIEQLDQKNQWLFWKTYQPERDRLINLQYKFHHYFAVFDIETRANHQNSYHM